ncbi:MAG: DUF2721 domain-containing protein [Akkermansiaceae bacterium]|nr:DUF2721 domain-containing protein [Akkermansiaceae bacterium]NNM29224.1 DUF2721 domain-containing protein [Akkermansiaceae bacterium]
MMSPTSVFEALQLAICPVILISAYGLLLLSLTNRLGRAIDRARLLLRDENLHSDLQVMILMRRARWIRLSILFIVVAIVSAASLVLVLFTSVFLQIDAKLIVWALFAASLFSLVVALSYFISEVFYSLSALEAEFDRSAMD